MRRDLPAGGGLSNQVTRLFGTRYPIVQGGMVWASGWRLAAAVSEAGGLGLVGAGSMTPGMLKDQIRKVREKTDAPFGVNIPLKYGPAEEMVRVCAQERVRAVFTSAGSPKKYTAKLQDAGCKVAHVVPSAALAKKVASAGCDAVVAEGTEAGGHNSPIEIPSMVLWPSAVDAVDIPVIAAGGISDGRGMAAAFALGAKGVQLGTRFALTKESSAHADYKRAGVDSEEGDARLYLRSAMPTRALLNEHVSQALALEARGATPRELLEMHGVGRSRKGILEGDVEQGDLEMGQVSSRITDLPSAREVVVSLVKEYHAVLARLTTGENHDSV